MAGILGRISVGRPALVFKVTHRREREREGGRKREKEGGREGGREGKRERGRGRGTWLSGVKRLAARSFVKQLAERAAACSRGLEVRIQGGWGLWFRGLGHGG